MDFLSWATNSIPVVGHVKGIVHYAVGDTKGGHQAMFQATRTAAVVGAGTAGALAGPAGTLYFGSVAQVMSDSVGTMILDEPQGVNWACSEIVNQNHRGEKKKWNNRRGRLENFRNNVCQRRKGTTRTTY
ncbi:GSCOCG00002884001-RA-CDS [Cotesia congregata]|nr:GSCOCG00002884001-RA-CDS [Cotesia congregata]